LVFLKADLVIDFFLLFNRHHRVMAKILYRIARGGQDRVFGPQDGKLALKFAKSGGADF
jgi:hypothetical protein